MSLTHPAACPPDAITPPILRRLGLPDDAAPREAAPVFGVPLASGRIVALTGPCGCGKSRALRALAQRAGERVRAVRTGDVPRLELTPGQWLTALGAGEQARRMLYDCGLSDAALLRGSLASLSAGERARLALAAALALSQPGDALVIDEFGAELDMLSARALASVLARTVEHRGLRCALATHREDLLPELRPIALFRAGPDGFARTVPRREPELIESLRIREGSRADWRHFARHHYRGASLGAVDRVFVAALGERDVGIAVYAYPGFGCAARRENLPDELCGGPLRERVIALNARLRVLQRLAVLPEFRGIGVGKRLAERTLPRLGVDFIEAISMDGGCLLRAGMRDCGEVALSRAARALSDALAAHGAQPHELAVPGALESFLASLDGCGAGVPPALENLPARQRIERRLRAALREHIESRHGAMRGEANAGAVSERAAAKLSELLLRLAHRPRYFLWASDAGARDAGMQG